MRYSKMGIGSQNDNEVQELSENELLANERELKEREDEISRLEQSEGISREKALLLVDREALRERFRYMIEIWAADRHRYEWLEKRTGIPAARWQNVLLDKQYPSIEMLMIICNNFPNYSFWLMTSRKSLPSYAVPTKPAFEHWEEFKTHRQWILKKRKKSNQTS